MNKITIKKIPFKLAGELTVPSLLNFKAIDKTNKTKSIDSYEGIKVISTFPDINTRVCDAQTMFISKSASQHPEVSFISVTNDTPEVIAEWCAANGVDNIDILSDKELKEFQSLTNTLIVKANKLARGFIILDKDNKVLDYSFLKEIAADPDYALVEKYLK